MRVGRGLPVTSSPDPYPFLFFWKDHPQFPFENDPCPLVHQWG